MKEIISLTKLFINTNLGLSLIQYNRKNNKKAFLKQVGLPVLVLVAMLPLYGLYVAYMAMMYTGMAAIGQVSVLLPMAYTVISVVIIFFGLAYIMAEFYFSGSVEMLLPLPIKPRNIIIGKFGSIIFMEVLLSAALMLPPAVIYGMGQGMGILYYMMALIVIVILPVLPLALETLLIMLLMRSNSFKGKKDVFQIVALFAVLAFFLGLQMYLSSMAGGSDDPMTMVNSMLADNGYLLKTITRMYPVSLLVAQSLNSITLTGMLSLLGLFILTAAAFALMVFVGERVYVKGLISGKESGRGKKALSVTKLQKALSHRSAPALAVFKMDMRLLLRTPIYFFNNVSIVVVVPLVFLMSMFFGKSGGMDIMTLVSDFYKAAPMPQPDSDRCIHVFRKYSLYHSYHLLPGRQKHLADLHRASASAGPDDRAWPERFVYSVAGHCFYAHSAGVHYAADPWDSGCFAGAWYHRLLPAAGLWPDCGYDAPAAQLG